MEIKITKVRGVKTPLRAHTTDAGIDFFVPDDYDGTSLKHGDSTLIPSGIKVILPKGKALHFVNKSGVASKKGLVLGACLVDEGYRGEIFFNIIKATKGSIGINAGDKIVQAIVVDIPSDEIVEISNETYDQIEDTDRGDGCLGSTGV